MKRTALIVCLNTVLGVIGALYFFVIPGGMLIHWLCDPGLRTGRIPRFAYRWHHSISQKFESWARQRVASGAAATLESSNVTGTEWPLFGTVFYLWTTEALQYGWKEGGVSVRPSDDAAGALAAAAALLTDPNHAAWVRDQWGEDYLHRQNLFYRMLLISGLTSYERLSEDHAHRSLLQDQVETLAAELDSSPFGLLEDYPGQTYPVDILPAIGAIRRADMILRTDHSAVIRRAVRAFQGARLDPATQLPAYHADSSTGEGFGGARGVGLSFMLIWAPMIWPETAAEWYPRYESLFWKRGIFLAGFREFPERSPYSDQFFFDIDAGPVLFGFGTAASAFGIGAARVNGHFDQAFPLSAEALVVSWPLPDGTFLVPRLLSNLADAPYLGETALLFNLTRQPSVIRSRSAGLPAFVYFAIGLYFLIGFLWISGAIRRWRRRVDLFPAPTLQLLVWIILVIAGLIALICSYNLIGIVLFLLAQLLPRGGHVLQKSDHCRT